MGIWVVIVIGRDRDGKYFVVVGIFFFRGEVFCLEF